MIWQITESYNYDPISVKEGKRLYEEAIAKLILKELEKNKINEEKQKAAG